MKSSKSGNGSIVLDPPTNGKSLNSPVVPKTSSSVTTMPSLKEDRVLSGNMRGQLRQLLATVKAVRQGDFSARFPSGEGIVSEIGDVLNDIIELNQSLAE